MRDRFKALDFVSKNDNRSTKPDQLLQEIADYVIDYEVSSVDALQAAKLCLKDAIGCAILSLRHEDCVKTLGPNFQGMECADGTPVPGTFHVLEPVQAAFNLGVMVRWLDYNDTWLAAEWSHPSDNLGGILSVGDYLSRKSSSSGELTCTMQQVLVAIVKAYEIQGVLALENSFNREGLDHVLLVRIATCAVVTAMLGGTKKQVVNALSNAWIDGGALRLYRHAPNTGSRKSWAAGDATARGVWHAVMALKGEMGYPSALSEPCWGFQSVFMKQKPIILPGSLGHYIVENVLFKVAFPAEFHAQTAAEAAIRLHAEVGKRISEIQGIEIHTQESAIRIIDKTGELKNPADRDHCLQYIVAVCLLNGELTDQHYYHPLAANPSIDKLRTMMTVTEDPQYSLDYLNTEKRSVANSVQVFFKDGSATYKVEIHYPIGHPQRRLEAIPMLDKKFVSSLMTIYQHDQVDRINELFAESENFLKLPVHRFMQNFIPQK